MAMRRWQLEQWAWSTTCRPVEVSVPTTDVVARVQVAVRWAQIEVAQSPVGGPWATRSEAKGPLPPAGGLARERSRASKTARSASPSAREVCEPPRQLAA